MAIENTFFPFIVNFDAKGPVYETEVLKLKKSK